MASDVVKRGLTAEKMLNDAEAKAKSLEEELETARMMGAVMDGDRAKDKHDMCQEERRRMWR